MVINFRAREIIRGTRKLAWTPTLKKNLTKNIFMKGEIQKLVTYIFNQENSRR